MGESFQQSWDEDRDGIVASAKNQEQDDEETGNDKPTLAFLLRHNWSP